VAGLAENRGVAQPGGSYFIRDAVTSYGALIVSSVPGFGRQPPFNACPDTDL
jgi:hypothetical protein